MTCHQGIIYNSDQPVIGYYVVTAVTEVGQKTRDGTERSTKCPPGLFDMVESERHGAQAHLVCTKRLDEKKREELGLTGWSLFDYLEQYRESEERQPRMREFWRYLDEEDLIEFVERHIALHAAETPAI